MENFKIGDVGSSLIIFNHQLIRLPNFLFLGQKNSSAVFVLCRSLLCYIGRSLLIRFLEQESLINKHLTSEQMYGQVGSTRLQTERLVGIVKVPFNFKKNTEKWRK